VVKNVIGIPGHGVGDQDYYLTQFKLAVPKANNIDKKAVFIWNDTDNRYEAWDGVLNTGDIEIGAVEIKNHDTDDRVEVDSDNRMKVKQGGMSGASTNGTSALTGANTWVQVPTTAPASDYVLVVTKENEAGTIRWSFENGGTPGATNGNQMWNDDIIFNLAASEVVYFGSSTDGDDVNWSAKVL